VTQLGHEPVLERAGKALHAPLGLRRAGEHLGDPQLPERPRELARRTSARSSGRRLEDAVAVGVERKLQATAHDDLLQQREVAASVFGRAKQRVRHIAGRIVDREQQRKPRSE